MVRWDEQRVLVTGGCSFIGSHLVDALVERGAAHVRVVDDLSTGERANIAGHLESGAVELVEGDLLVSAVAQAAVQDIDVVFHLAAIHGGRGYIDLHQSECAANLVLDGNVIHAARNAGVEKLVFASSGCVYPVQLQDDVTRDVYLSEPMVGPPYDPDGTYGWAKLSTELTLRACYEESGFKSVSCRLFTVYGERCHETHAILAMIGRAFLRRDPFEIWGDGSQIRNWTYVGDIVRGLVLAGERIDDARAINLGTEEPITVMQAARLVLEMTGLDATIQPLTHMPTGPVNRVASNRLAAELLEWQPETSFPEGLARTIEWYFQAKASDRDKVDERFSRMLLERTAA